MRIQYRATGHHRNVDEGVGRMLVRNRIADPVLEDGQYMTASMDAEISPRTGKPKRKYRRRDMRAEN